jgi:Spy/CpxP family protein refolding chaperone
MFRAIALFAALPMLALAQTPPAPPAQAPPPQPHPPGGGMMMKRRAPEPPRPDLGKWWKNSQVVQEIQLTPAQIDQIEKTFLEHRLKLIDLRADVERQETRLQPLIEADTPDEAAVSAQLDLVLAARSRLEKANAMMMLAIRRTLTVNQWRRLEELRQEREAPAPPAPPAPPGMKRRMPMPPKPEQPAEPGLLC